MSKKKNKQTIIKLQDGDDYSNSTYDLIQFDKEIDSVEFENYVSNCKWENYEDLIEKIEKKFGKFEYINENFKIYY